MARTTQQQLDDLDAMIAQIEALAGISDFGQGTQRNRTHDLPALYARRDALEKKLASETGTGGFELIEPMNS